MLFRSELATIASHCSTSLSRLQATLESRQLRLLHLGFLALSTKRLPIRMSLRRSHSRSRNLYPTQLYPGTPIIRRSQMRFLPRIRNLHQNLRSSHLRHQRLQDLIPITHSTTHSLLSLLTWPQILVHLHRSSQSPQSHWRSQRQRPPCCQILNPSRNLKHNLSRIHNQHHLLQPQRLNLVHLLVLALE